MKKNTTLLTTVLFLLISVFGIAQSVLPSAPEGAQGTPPVGLPIDNGIIFLFVAGVIYGVYKLVAKKKASNV